MSKTPPVQESPNFLDFITVSGLALDKAAAAHEKSAAMQAKVAALIPTAVEALIANGRIQPHQKAAATQALQDHDRCIEMLTKMASHRNTEEQAGLGTPTGDASAINKTASTAAKTKLAPSDIAFFTGLGLPVPGLN